MVAHSKHQGPMKKKGMPPMKEKDMPMKPMPMHKEMHPAPKKAAPKKGKR